MNSTSPTITTTTLSSNVPDENKSGLSSMAIGIIVLCVVCGLVLAALCAFIIMNRRRLFSHSAKKRMVPSTIEDIEDDYERDKEIDEKPTWRFWPSFLKSAPLIESTDNNRQNIKPLNGPTTKASDQDTQPPFTVLSSLPAIKISTKKKKTPTATMTRRTMLDDIPLPPTNLALLTPPPSISITKVPMYKKGQQELFEEGYDHQALRSPYYQHRPRHQHQHQQQQHNQFTASVCTLTNASSEDSVSSSVNDPSLLESLERQKQINGMYYKTASTSAGTHSTYRHHRQSPSWGSSTIIQQPCIGKSNNNSSLLSLSTIEKQEQEAELQRLSTSSYHVW